MDLSTINWLAVAVCALASFVVGSLWYSPILFGRRWQKELGFTDEYLKEGNMGLIFGSSFVMMFIMIIGLAMLMTKAEDPSLIQGFVHGIIVGAFFIGTSMGVNYLYQRRSIALWFIDAGYQVFYLGISGAILAVWR